jgi:hypothetical protein
MARPAKQTVDYFPHRCKGGKTLYILETRYSDKGYTFWFKVLETLGETEGHAFRFDDPTNQEYFLAKTRTTTEQAIEIFNLLAKLEAIDKELWEKGHIVWSDNFIDGIKDAYRNRTISMPTKPVFDVRNTKSLRVSNVINPQIKEDKIREDKNKPKEIILPEFINREKWDAYMEIREKKKATPTPRAIELLIEKLTKFKADGDDPNEVLEESIMNNWTGVFALKKGGANGKGRANPKSATKFGTDYEDPNEIFGAGYYERQGIAGPRADGA